MPYVSGDTAAWAASPSIIDFLPQEGRTSAITIQMRPTNIMKIVVSGNPYVGQCCTMPRGQMSVTFPNGMLVDFADFSNNGGTVVLSNRLVGEYVFRANPVVASGVTYVPDAPTQTVSLPAVGRVVVAIRFAPR